MQGKGSPGARCETMPKRTRRGHTTGKRFSVHGAFARLNLPQRVREWRSGGGASETLRAEIGDKPGDKQNGDE